MRLSLWLVAFAMVYTFADPTPYSPARVVLLLLVFGWSFALAVVGDVVELRWMRGGGGGR